MGDFLEVGCLNGVWVCVYIVDPNESSMEEQQSELTLSLLPRANFFSLYCTSKVKVLARTALLH